MRAHVKHNERIDKVFLFISILMAVGFFTTGSLAQDSRPHPESDKSRAAKKSSPAPPAPVAAPRTFGIGTANGSGMGTANGTGVGAANGSGIGAGNGSGMGGTSTTSAIDLAIRPTSKRVFRSPHTSGNSVGNAAGTGIGTASNEGLGSVNGVGTGKATGAGVGNATTESVEAAKEIHTYIKEADGRCYFVTKLGEKSFVDKGKCVLYQ